MDKDLYIIRKMHFYFCKQLKNRIDTLLLKVTHLFLPSQLNGLMKLQANPQKQLTKEAILIYLKNPPPLAVVMYLGLCRMINFDG
jgi:hypothetical protein